MNFPLLSLVVVIMLSTNACAVDTDAERRSGQAVLRARNEARASTADPDKEYRYDKCLECAGRTGYRYVRAVGDQTKMGGGDMVWKCLFRTNEDAKLANSYKKMRKWIYKDKNQCIDYRSVDDDGVDSEPGLGVDDRTILLHFFSKEYHKATCVECTEMKDFQFAYQAWSPGMGWKLPPNEDGMVDGMAWDCYHKNGVDTKKARKNFDFFDKVQAPCPDRDPSEERREYSEAMERAANDKIQRAKEEEEAKRREEEAQLRKEEEKLAKETQWDKGPWYKYWVGPCVKQHIKTLDHGPTCTTGKFWPGDGPPTRLSKYHVAMKQRWDQKWDAYQNRKDCSCEPRPVTYSEHGFKVFGRDRPKECSKESHDPQTGDPLKFPQEQTGGLSCRPSYHCKHKKGLCVCKKPLLSWGTKCKMEFPKWWKLDYPQNFPVTVWRDRFYLLPNPTRYSLDEWLEHELGFDGGVLHEDRVTLMETKDQLTEQELWATMQVRRCADIDEMRDGIQGSDGERTPCQGFDVLKLDATSDVVAFHNKNLRDRLDEQLYYHKIYDMPWADWNCEEYHKIDNCMPRRVDVY